MQNLFGKTVFAVGDTDYTWEDVVLFAKARGDWTELKNQVAEGLACLRSAEATSYSIPVQDVTSDANAFRYRRNLITAEETETWLKLWRLSVEDWMGYIRRSLLRRRWADELREIVARYPVPDDEISTCLQAEGICSGNLARFARNLAGRAATCQKTKERAEDVISRERIQSQLGVFLKNIDSYDMEGLSRESLREKMENLARLETVFERITAGAITADALRSCVAANRIEWIKLVFDFVTFADEHQAREGSLCVREDQMTLSEVAAEAQVPVRQATLYIEELKPEVKSQFLACGVGDLLGPLRWEGHYALCRVVDKTMPDEAEPQIRQKANQAILDRLVNREINDRVRWHVALE